MELHDLKDSRLKPKRSPNYVSVAISKEINIKVNKICNELNCSKAKFVTLAINKLIAEYEKESAE
tara:strand:+ start:1786 stop:1980 length:195 start_codon:yes stop_codon:yes gene_type:complete